jgi:putative spermidine/putrescine transport system permease protein
MATRWHLLLWPPFVLFLAVLALTQLTFLSMSFFPDLGFGQVGTEPTLANYREFLTERFYINSLLLTLRISASAVAIALLLAYPTAYLLARMRSGRAALLLSCIVATSFITIVVKALGLNIIFGADGPMNGLLLWLGVVQRPVQLSGEIKVLIGLTQYTLGFFVLLLYGVIQTIPPSLEEAARIHGAGAVATFFRVIVPLSLPGVISGGLIVFNLCMGAFTSAALLGGGKVPTLPVVVYQTLLVETRYGMAAALSAVLLLIVVLINLISALLFRQSAAIRSGIRA